MGLDPGTPGSHSEPKADAQLLSHPGVLQKPELFKMIETWRYIVADGTKTMENGKGKWKMENLEESKKSKIKTL